MRLRDPWAAALGVCAALLTATTAAAQWPATLGIYDDAALSQDSGTMDGPLKEIYLGLSFDPADRYPGMTGLEFSIAGLEPFVLVSVEWMPPPVVALGTLAAPADTLAGTGGIAIAWATCLEADRVIAKLVLAASVPPQNHTLQVRRRYPPSNPLLAYALAWTCDMPCFGCHYRLTGPAYVLNPLIAVEPRTWGAIKRLYAPGG